MINSPLNDGWARIPILMYHSISEQAQPKFKKFTLSPEQFDLQLEYLKSQGYTAYTVSQLVQFRANKEALPTQRPVVLTFDDGFADFHSQALPILKRHNMTATLYTTTGYMGQTSRWLESEGEADRAILNWEQLAEIAANGIEIGGHTQTHAQLDVLDRTQALHEIADCKTALEKQLGREIETFAYPFGYHSAATKRLVQEAGYKSACAVKYNMSSLQDDLFALSRLIVTHDTRLETLLNTSGLAIIPLAKRIANPAWRLFRAVQAKHY